MNAPAWGEEHVPPRGQIGYLKQDGADLGEVSTRWWLDNIISFTPISSNSSTTITYEGAKVPFTLVATKLDTSVFPAVETEEEADFGPSNDTLVLTTFADEAYSALRIKRRF